jgi:hypothetical protein
LDKALEKAFEISNYMATLASQKQIYKEEFYQNLIHYQNGGSFSVTRELINFVKTLIDLGHDTNTVVIDDNDIPIEIEDLKAFQEQLISVYYGAVNEYYSKYSLLKTKRTVDSLVDYD